MNEGTELKKGDVVQLTGIVRFYHCFMVVTEVKGWGAVGYIPAPSLTTYSMRASWDEMEYVGHAPRVIE